MRSRVFATRQTLFDVGRHVNVGKAHKVVFGSSLWLNHDCLFPRRPGWARTFTLSSHRAAKRVSKKTTKELTQGAIKGEPLPPADKDDLRQDTMLQVVRNCMIKFPQCVLLTKVGNFYEAGHIS